MMSRSRTLALINSSRQMMIAWKVRGLSHRPAIIASRPASMRLATAISPSRESSSTEPMSRRYMRTGSSVRSAGSVRACVIAGIVIVGPVRAVGSGRTLLVVLALNHGDAHVRQHRHRVFDLLGGDLL